MRISVTIFAVEKQSVLHILCVCVCVFVVLIFQHAQRMVSIIIVICSLSDSNIFFPHHIINGTILEETVLNIKYMF